MSELKIHHFNNTGFSFFVLIMSLAYLYSANTLGPPLINARLSPSFFPLILGGISTLLSIALLIRTVRANIEHPVDDTQVADGSGNRGHLRALLAMVSTGVFVLLFQTLGFFVTTIPYVLAIVLIFSNREKIVQKLIYSVLIASAGYFLFSSIFNVRLPVLWG